MSTNDFLPFCPTDTGTNLESQSTYAADTSRTNGNQPGVASSKLNNKAIRQGTALAAQLAQYISNVKAVDVLDDGNATTLLSKMTSALIAKKPIITQYTTGSGTWNKTYKFAILSGSATAGATYTNNAVTYTVSITAASATEFVVTGNGDPTANGGTLTKASGTGDATITFQCFSTAMYIKVLALGAGGGGGGTGTGGTGGNGNGGGTTTFGSSLITAAGGTGGVFNGGNGGDGGAATLAAGPTGFAINGTGGCPAIGVNATAGGSGGTSAIGGAGRGGGVSSSGVSASANSGSGGGGGSGFSSVQAAGGGGAGAYILCTIFAPSASYAYAVGAKGTGHAAGTGGNNGGDGADGFLQITEIFQ